MMTQLNSYLTSLFISIKNKLKNAINKLSISLQFKLVRFFENTLFNIVKKLISIDYNKLLYYLLIFFDFLQFIYFILYIYNIINGPIDLFICLYLYSKIRSYIFFIIESFITTVITGLILGDLTIEGLFYISLTFLKNHSKNVISVIILCIYCIMSYNSVFFEIIFIFIMS
jgi:hypothetical protein